MYEVDYEVDDRAYEDWRDFQAETAAEEEAGYLLADQDLTLEEYLAAVSSGGAA